MIRDEEAFNQMAVETRDAVLALLVERLLGVDDTQLSVAITFGTLLGAARVVVASKADDVPAEAMADAFVAMAKDAAAMVVTEARAIGQGGSGSRA